VANKLLSVTSEIAAQLISQAAHQKCQRLHLSSSLTLRFWFHLLLFFEI